MRGSRFPCWCPERCRAAQASRPGAGDDEQHRRHRRVVVGIGPAVVEPVGHQHTGGIGDALRREAPGERAFAGGEVHALDQDGHFDPALHVDLRAVAAPAHDAIGGLERRDRTRRRLADRGHPHGAVLGREQQRRPIRRQRRAHAFVGDGSEGSTREVGAVAPRQPPGLGAADEQVLAVGEPLYRADRIEAPAAESSRGAGAGRVEHHFRRTGDDGRRPSPVGRQAFGAAGAEAHRLGPVGGAQHDAVAGATAQAYVDHQQLAPIGRERSRARRAEPRHLPFAVGARHAYPHPEGQVFSNDEPAAVGPDVVHDEPRRRAQHGVVRCPAIGRHGHRLHLPAAGRVAREDERLAVGSPCQPFDRPEFGRQRAGGPVASDDHDGAAVVEAPRMRDKRHPCTVGRHPRIAQVARGLVPGRANRVLEPIAAVAKVVHDRHATHRRGPSRPPAPARAPPGARSRASCARACRRRGAAAGSGH